MGHVHFTSYNYVFGCSLMIVAFLSILASLISLVIIHRLGKFSGYIVLVYSMTVCQICYDISFFFFPGYQLETIYSVIQVLSSFGGLSVSIWTNILSGVILYISTYHKPVDIWAYYPYFMLISVVPSAIWASMVVVVNNDKLMDNWYNYLRFMFILFNFMVYVVISINLSRLGNGEIYKPLRELSRRFKYYPICQVLTRIPAVYYQYRYGFGTDDFGSPKSTAEIVALMFYCLTVPSAGIAYFVVFLFMQPQAFTELKQMIYYICPCLKSSITSTSIKFTKYTPENISNGLSENSSNSGSDQVRYYYFNPTATLRGVLNKPLIPKLNGDSSSESQERLSDVCYSPLTESALDRYRNLGDDELCESMVHYSTFSDSNNPETGLSIDHQAS